MTIEEVLSRLERVHRSGDGHSARCPAHDDQHPSLSVTERNSKILIHCHTGCEPEAVFKALDLTFHDPDTGRGQNGRSDIVATYDYRVH